MDCFILKWVFLYPDHNSEISWSCTHGCVSPAEPLASHRLNKKTGQPPNTQIRAEDESTGFLFKRGCCGGHIGLECASWKTEECLGCQGWPHRTHSSRRHETRLGRNDVNVKGDASHLCTWNNSLDVFQ